MSKPMNTAHGIVALLKPPGMTSHDVVAHVRRVLKLKRVGHTGTLDPAAAGVMLVCVGQATRLVEALQTGYKEYLAEATFGYETDTLDAVGETIRECDATSLDQTDLERACHAFRGDIRQFPPMHSAIKVGGQRLHKIARAGETVDIPSRAVSISVLEVTRFSPGQRPRAFLRVECSRGTYIRSLVRDIGRELGNAATMTFLSRIRNGHYFLEQAATPEEFERIPQWVPLPDVLQVLYGPPQVHDAYTNALWQGQRINVQIDVEAKAPELEAQTTVLALWSNIERTIWILARGKGDKEWVPEKVFDLRDN